MSRYNQTGESHKARARREHFANGGSVATWRGRATTYADKKAKANKSACRGKNPLT